VTVTLKGINPFRFALPDVADTLCDVMLLYVFELRENWLREGRPYVSCAGKSKHAPAVKPHDILKVKNALTKYGYCVTERTSCSHVIIYRSFQTFAVL
jgi:hypothetical protein